MHQLIMNDWGQGDQQYVEQFNKQNKRLIYIYIHVYVNVYVISYVRDNVQNAGHYGENKPRPGNGLPLKWLIFNDRRSIHYPAHDTATCQNEEITSNSVSF